MSAADKQAAAGDDEARIAEWYHQAANQRGAYIDDGRTLMRSLLARAVKAEAELERLRGRDAEPFDWDAEPNVQEWIEENLPEREPRAGSMMVELHADEVVAYRGEARLVAGWLKDIMAENADLRAKLALLQKP